MMHHLISNKSRIPRTVEIGPFSIIGIDCEIGEFVRVGKYCEIRNNCTVGRGTTFGSRCTISANAKIGKNCTIKYGCVLTDTPDPKNDSIKLVGSIGDNVVIGANVTIMPGVHIGNGAIIGACSQVRHDVPDGEVWFGNPAKKLR